jgi:hypothetical protein
MRAAACSTILGFVAVALTYSAEPDVRSLMNAGHWKQARARLEARVKAQPSDAEATAMLSQVRLAFGDLEGAVQLADAAVKADGRVADYHWQLARAYGEQARYANLLNQFLLSKRLREEAETAIALDPKHIDARLGLIVFYVNAPGIAGGDRAKADQIAADIANIDAASGYLARARIVADTKSGGDLEALYRQAAAAARSDQTKYDAISGLMNFYLSQKPPNDRAAAQQARDLIALDRHRSAGYVGLATAFASVERWTDLDAALVDAERAVSDDLAPYYHAGRIIVTQGADYARAERYLRKYLTQEPEGAAPTTAFAHWRLAAALEKQGKRAEAIAELEAALRLKADLDGAKKDLSRLRGS